MYKPMQGVALTLITNNIMCFLTQTLVITINSLILLMFLFLHFMLLEIREVTGNDGRERDWVTCNKSSHPDSNQADGWHLKPLGHWGASSFRCLFTTLSCAGDGLMTFFQCHLLDIKPAIADFSHLGASEISCKHNIYILSHTLS